MEFNSSNKPTSRVAKPLDLLNHESGKEWPILLDCEFAKDCKKDSSFVNLGKKIYCSIDPLMSESRTL